MNGKNPDTSRSGPGTLLLLVAMLLVLLRPAAGLGNEFILLYSNDNRGETEPCG
ncbi:MAG: hypothetical protein RBR09_06290 [Desulfobulbaceae bacterium]|nr:hypothetical protein [Desulfobulbaceae bacterium]